MSCTGRRLTQFWGPCVAAQYYFETIFPRIPKPVHDDFVSKLTALGLPSRAVGNAGQGGTDRRGIEEANRRPASVKASLSVAPLPLLFLHFHFQSDLQCLLQVCQTGALRCWGLSRYRLRQGHPVSRFWPVVSWSGIFL